MNPESAGPDEIRTFIDELQEERDLSDRTVNHAIFEIKYLYLSVFGQSWNPYLVPTRKFDEFIAFVPTHEEVEKLLSSVDDPELLAAFSIMYGSGLRISEVCHCIVSRLYPKKCNENSLFISCGIPCYWKDADCSCYYYC